MSNSNFSPVREWKNIEDFFFFLNKNITYVVLRNYECLPDKYTMKDHEDIDLLVSSLDEFKIYVGGKNNSRLKFKGYSTIVKINNEEVKLDIRYVGDGYYDSKWEKNILDNRVKEKDLFYRADDYNYKYSLAYHSIFHKYKFSEEYSSRLAYMFGKVRKKLEAGEVFKLVDDFMRKKGYYVSEPRDIYVEFSNKYVKDICLFRRKALKLVLHFIYILKRLPYKIKELIWAKK